MSATSAEASQPHVYWTPSTTNFKTGPIPTAYVGATREESMKSCQGCPLLANRNCYAQFGTPGLGHVNVILRAAKGKDYTLEHALANRKPEARLIRLSAVGEPGKMSRWWWETTGFKARAAGLEVLAYIHNWRSRRDLAGFAMASCDGDDALADADRAIAKGFRAAVVLPENHEGRTFRTPAGHKGVVCPAMLAPGKVTCNTCRLCVASRPGPVIGFPDHGPTTEKGDPELPRKIVDYCAVEPRTLREITETMLVPPITARFAVQRLVRDRRMRRVLDANGKAITTKRNAPEARGKGAFLYAPVSP